MKGDGNATKMNTPCVLRLGTRAELKSLGKGKPERGCSTAAGKDTEVKSQRKRSDYSGRKLAEGQEEEKEDRK